MTALITLPVRDHINAPLRSALSACRLPWLPIYGSSDLPQARSVLLTQALAHGADCIVCIDADIVATAEQILQLANHPRVNAGGAVTGLYALRSGEAWACTAPNGETEPDGCRPAEYAGLGFACISRASLLAVRDSLPRLEDPRAGEWWPFCVPFVGERNGRLEYCADDVSLWRRLEDAGTPLWADTTLIVGHQALVVLHSPVDQGPTRQSVRSERTSITSAPKSTVAGRSEPYTLLTSAYNVAPPTNMPPSPLETRTSSPDCETVNAAGGAAQGSGSGGLSGNGSSSVEPPQASNTSASANDSLMPSSLTTDGAGARVPHRHTNTGMGHYASNQ